MDPSQRRKAVTQFYLSGLSNLAVFCILYIYLIRPIHIEMVQQWIIPLLNQFNSNPDFIFLSLQDDYWIESKSNRFLDVFLNLPFNGYFWIAITGIIAFGKRQLSKIILTYNFLLFVIHPILIAGLLNDQLWTASLLRIHETVYKAIFLSLGMLAVATGYKEARTSR